MKKTLIILFAFAATLVSCGSDDDVAQPPLDRASISGTYNVNFLRIEEIEVDVINNVDIVTNTTSVGDTFTNFNFTFSENGQFTVNGSFRFTVTTNVAGNVRTESFVESTNDSGTYSISMNGNVITLNFSDGSTEAYNVTSFDGTNLRLLIEETDGNDSYREEVRLTRQSS